jgi:glycosyltransferase involved in cell wall biosynthesis
MPKLLYGVSSSFCAHFLHGQLEYMKSCGYDVSIISPTGEEMERLTDLEQAKLYEVDFSNSITPFHDLLNLFEVFRILLKERPQIVNAGHPKSGLLIMLACWFLGIGKRIFTLHGLVSDTQRGWKKFLIRFAEKMTCSLAERVIVVSPSLLDHAVACGILNSNKGRIIEYGSCNGIDLKRFSRTEKVIAESAKLRAIKMLPSASFTLGFIGRISADKGMDLLINVFNKLRRRHPNLCLVIAGSMDHRDPISVSSKEQIHSAPNIYYLGKMEDIVPVYPMMDLLVLPSYREGFGNVLIEAAAMGVPVIAPDIPGCRDALQSGKNGSLFRKGDEADLEKWIETYIQDPELLHIHGANGRDIVEFRFNQERLWKGLVREYDDIRLQ